MTLPPTPSSCSGAVGAVLLRGEHEHWRASRRRAHLHRDHPELARRLVWGADYRFGEWILVEPALAVHGPRRLRRLDRRNRTPR
ncbi:hypothetical protein E1262_09755 [Jiangella aurantiaca]|uniref:Uncharacterized protein n=1 Tax=Jiangella aurantiaca TaxID=2530373 RepID=A0A4R5ADJ2_9ACTN|nr:hypothetical protein [Jiangella aurantiaca]TDD70513.1 hypothetical protein E1262_09755 [Jiangella aurantiaca]